MSAKKLDSVLLTPSLSSLYNPIKYVINVNSIGAFESSLSHPSADVGNFRMIVGDSLLINLPAGSLINQRNVKLCVTDGIGNQASFAGIRDSLSNLQFHWTAERTAAGPCWFSFEYSPFQKPDNNTFSKPQKAAPATPAAPAGSATPAAPAGSATPAAPGGPAGPAGRAAPAAVPSAAGAVTTDSSSSTSARLTSVINCILVSPQVVINGKHIPLESICMQTVMSRCVGTVDTWVDRLEHPTANLNYNAIHFTPIQTTGESGSCYSIADQLSIDKAFLPKKDMSKEESWSLVKSVVGDLESRFGLMSVSDVVLNHTANNTEWLPSHPECGYNQRNSPYLNAAIELDLKLQQFSCEIVDGKWKWLGVSAHVEDHDALRNIRSALQDKVLQPFQMNEWFEINFNEAIEEYRRAKAAEGTAQKAGAPPAAGTVVAAVASKSTKKNSNLCKSEDDIRHLMMLECLNTVGTARRTGVVPAGQVSKSLCRDENHLRSVLQSVQNELYKKANQTIYRILDAAEGYVGWERLHCRKGPIKKEHWNALLPRYFTPIVEASTKETLYLANNGWVMDWNAENDFAAPGALVYLSRSLVVWSDCIKLRYGNAIEDCPFLWNLMREYCITSAKVFHGIRLDNCHSTPLHVASYCLKESRKSNPKMWVYAELFTGKRETDLKFERELGLDALVREAMQSFNCWNLANCLREVGGSPIGTLHYSDSLNRLHTSNGGLVALRRTSSPSLLFDCTHDNDTPYQKRTAFDYLSNAAAVAACFSAIGSTRGYDELVPKVLSVVTERRLYHSYEELSKAEIGSDEASGTETSHPHKKPTAMPKREILIETRMHSNSSNSLVAKGSWDGWKSEIPMSLTEGLWVGKLTDEFVPSNDKDFVVYEFKFVLNGKVWFYDESLPHGKDHSGSNINNRLTIGKDPVTHTKPTHIDPRLWGVECEKLPGIMEARRDLNAIHQFLSEEGFVEMEIEMRGDDVMVITRHDPLSHRFCLFFIYTAFSSSSYTQITGHSHIGSNRYETKGRVKEILLEAKLSLPKDLFYVNETDYINGLASLCTTARKTEGSKSQLGLFECSYDERHDRSSFVLQPTFTPGSVFVLMTNGYVDVYMHVSSCINNLDYIYDEATEEGSTKMDKRKAEKSKRSINEPSRSSELQAFSYLLYSCANEELDRTEGKRTCYGLPGVGDLPYAGIASLVSLFDKLRYLNEKSHPLIDNIRAGDWLVQYTIDRLESTSKLFSDEVDKTLKKISAWIQKTFKEVKTNLPRILLPFYVDWIVSSLYGFVSARVMLGVPLPLQSCQDPFLFRLALASLQFYTFVPSSPLVKNTKHPSLCAGLPHFSTGYMRSWGRDTFIAFKGCLILLGRFEEARDELLAYAETMRHGLIPNLLDAVGDSPRYNARDATWFFLQSIQDYCTAAPEGLKFLSVPISLRYKEALPEGVEIKTVGELMDFILSQHLKGIKFREWNAGQKIDSCMKDEGFNITIEFDPETGFLHGGNRWNCGTWMDKMGSSYEAGNLGTPATPRDGAAVEILGLLKSTLRFVNSLPSTVWASKFLQKQQQQQLEERKGKEGDSSSSTAAAATVTAVQTMTYKKWAELIDKSFEKYFYIGGKEGCGDFIDTKLINRYPIVRDLYKASETWRDYQLRPNFCVTLAVAPELTTSSNAVKALKVASKELFRAKTPEEAQAIFSCLKKRFETDDANEFQRLMNGSTQQVSITDGSNDGNGNGSSSNFVLNSSDDLILFTKQLGIKTLDSSDYNYRPNYNNSDRTTDFQVAHGFNYHNGPEWVWPVGYFLQALFVHLLNSFSSSPNKDDQINFAKFYTMRYLMQHRLYMASDEWISLPELTNDNGRCCKDSCRAQAWSIGTLLAFLNEVAKVQK